MDKIKIGQIGVGHAHAAGKMAVYRASPDYEVVGVVETDPGLRGQAEQGAPYQGLTWMTQEQLLNVPGLKAVAVETRVRDLLDAAEACVDAGMHVHIDKPAGSSLPRFKRILDAAASKHLAVQLGYMFRYSPAVRLMRDLLQKGWLGEPFEVHSVMSKVVAPGDRQRLGEYPGGIMFELGCHIIDLCVGVLGRPEQVTAFRQRSAEDSGPLLDNMLAVFTYPRAVASIKSSALEVEGFARRHFVVCGTEGTMHIQPLDAPNVQLALSRPRGEYAKGYQEIKFGDYERYVGDAADLAAIIRGERECEFGYDHEFAVQETVLRACDLSVE